MGTTVVVARTLLRGLLPGRYPRGGSVHLRLWFTESWAAAAGAENLSCAPWTAQYARALGATIGRDVDLHALPPVTGLLTLGNGCAVEPEVDLRGHWLDGDVLRVGRVRIDKRATVGTRSTLAPGTRVGAWAEVAPGSAVLDSVPPGELWVGSPAVFDGPSRRHWPRDKAPRGGRWVAAYGATAAALAALPVVAAVCGLLVVGVGLRDATTWSEAALDAAAGRPARRPHDGRGARRGHARGRAAARARLPRGVPRGAQPGGLAGVGDAAAHGRRAHHAVPALLEHGDAGVAAGARGGHRQGRGGVDRADAPTLTTVGDGAFLADDTLIGSYELGHGWLRVERSKVGKRAFLGNSGMIAPGRTVPKRGLVAVLSATPEDARAGTSWLGSPPVKLRRVAGESDDARTFAPPTRLRVARALVELCRIVPVICTFGIGVAVLLVLQAALDAWGLGAAAALSPLVVLAAAGVACALATAAKWLLVGRLRPGDHPLWSSFIWRNELADTFLEVVAVPWLGPATVGSPALTVWLRTLGARIGRGVWCETYWLPEADLVTLGDASTVNRGCVLQTHLFHDRVMSMDTVELGRGASLGPHGVVLPAASLDDGARVGPASLVLRGDTIPAGSRWTGNPVSPA